MKTPTFDHLNLTKPTSGPRNQREDLIEQIVAQCRNKTPADDRKLARLLAITTNAAKWSTTDLHALLKKKNDPSIRNYTAFVWWSAKQHKKV